MHAISNYMVRPTKAFIISDSDLAILKNLAASPATRQGLAIRARILQLSIEGLTLDEIKEETGASHPTVIAWRKRFREHGMAGLEDSPRSGRPTTLDEKTIEKVIKMTVEQIPQEATFWSERLMAKYAGISTSRVRKIWASADLRPHRVKNFKNSNDPNFVEKVSDVVGLYMNPPINAVVMSIDEKTQIQALERTQRMLPLVEGKTETRTHDYKRNGTASLYAAFDIASGEVIGKLTDKHRAREFIQFITQVEAKVDAGLDLHMIIDNSSTHKTKEVNDWLANHPRVRFHFTPTSASWLNAVEQWFAQLEKRSLRRNGFHSVQELKKEITRHIKAHNKYSAKPFIWKKPAAEILEKVAAARKSLES